MCFFERNNFDIKGKAYNKGITSFKCGSCPECLSERARFWALRCSMQAKETPAVMVTLTYDEYIRDENGKILGEKVSDKKVDKRDCQLFIKRLRKRFEDRKIKYLLSAEYGKRTNRPHYHAILFNVVFDDIVYYKKSKRNNIIYKSNLLSKIWNNGICTVDCINVSAKVVRYCTKYCAKDSGADDTFMLMSRGIGDTYLLKEFDGKSYWIDGREYPIPKLIWQKYIIEKYKDLYPYVSFKYYNLNFDKNGDSFFNDFEVWKYYTKIRELSTRLKDEDILYNKYISYWQDKALNFERSKKNVRQRILELPNEKYFKYKNDSLKAFDKFQKGYETIVPRSKRVSSFYKNLWKKFGVYISDYNHLPLTSRHNTANDTKIFSNKYSWFYDKFPNAEIYNLDDVPADKFDFVYDKIFADCPF